MQIPHRFDVIQKNDMQHCDVGFIRGCYDCSKQVGSSVESADQAVARLEGTLSLILREILSHRNLKAVNSR
jgi:hypothetical protein